MARSSAGPVLLLALLLVVATGGVVATPSATAPDGHPATTHTLGLDGAAINETTNGSADASSTTTTTTTETAETVIGTVGDAVGDTVDETVDATTDTVSTVTDPVTTTSADTGTGTTDGGSSDGSGTTDAVTNTTDAIAETTDTATDTVTNTTDTVTNTTDASTDATNSTVDAVTDTTDDATDGVDDAVNTTAGGLDATSRRLDGVLGIGETLQTATSPVVGATRAVDETTDAVDATTDTVDDTTESLGGTTDSVVSQTADTVDVVSTGVSGASGTVLHGGVSGETDATVDASLDDGDGLTADSDGPQTTTAVGDGATGDTDGSVEVRTSVESAESSGDRLGPARWLSQRLDGLVPFAGPLDGSGAAGAAGAAGVGALAVSGYATRQWLSQTASTGGTGTQTVLSAGFADGLDGWVEKLKRLVVPLRYSRYDDSDPLEHDARRALYEAIEDAPGVYLTDLAERADVPVSTARHHVRVLADERLVRTAKRHGKRRFYPATVDDSALTDALAEPAKASVLHALAAHEEAHVGLLADELDRDPSTVTHHLQALADDDLVERERRGRTVVNRLASDIEPAITGAGTANDGGEPSNAPADD